MHAMSIQCKRDNDINTRFDAEQKAPVAALIKRPICPEICGVVVHLGYRYIDDVITVTFQRDDIVQFNLTARFLALSRSALTSCISLRTHKSNLLESIR